MDGTDAEAVRTEVTGEPDKKTDLPEAVPDPLMRLNTAKEPKKENPSSSNIVLISFIFLLFFGIVCAALYLFGFFGSWEEESIDYGLITNLPDENIESFVYITAKEDAFKEASSMLGELLGGGLLKEIKKANIAYVQYSGGASGFAVYLESGQSIPGLAETLGNYLYPTLSLSQNKLGIEKKNVQGIDYYLIKTPGGYSAPICAWQPGRGIVLLYYSSGYSGSNKDDCNSLIGKKSSKRNFQNLLTQPESIRGVLKTDDIPYAQGWFWFKSSDSMGSLQPGEKSAYGQLYSDKDGIYVFGAGAGLSEKSAQSSGLCEGGSIIKTFGKEACRRDSTGSGIPLMPMSSAVSYERGVGKYTIYAFAYPKTQDKESVKKKAEKFIFSAVFSGNEKTWNDRKRLTVSVKEDDTHKPVEGAHLVVNKDYVKKVAEASTDASGSASFKDLPIEYFQVKAEKEGYLSTTTYVYSTDTDLMISLKKKDAPALASKPKCGNALCESGENCGNCPADCKCYKGDCVNGACRNVSYSIELPSVKNGSWNVTYRPLGEKIKVQSDNCFYLDVLSSSGEEIEPYDTDVKKCVSAHGIKYNTTGPGAAPWFNWGGCAGTKYFQVDPGTDLVLRVYTESCVGCVCYYPQFNVYDMVGNSWVKYAQKNDADIGKLSDLEKKNKSDDPLAVRYLDIGTCDNMSAGNNSILKEKKSDCYAAVAEQKPKICGLIGDPAATAWCYFDVAVARKQESVCEMIDDQSLTVKKSCNRVLYAVTDMHCSFGSGPNSYYCKGTEVEEPVDDSSPYTLDLAPGIGPAWDVAYYPASDSIAIVSRTCFQLDIFRPSGEEIDPYDADVPACTGPDGKVYNSTGKGSAPWIGSKGCGKKRYYNVARGEKLILRVSAVASCSNPMLNIYEDIKGRWRKFTHPFKSALRVIQINATDGSDGAIEKIDMLVSRDSVGETVNFMNIHITLDSSNTAQMFEYSKASAVGSGYNISYEKGPYYGDGIISPQDRVLISLPLSRPIGADEKVLIEIRLAYGKTTKLDIKSPEVVSERQIVLYQNTSTLDQQAYALN